MKSVMLLILPFLLLAHEAPKAQEGDSVSAKPAADQNEEFTKLKGSVDGLSESYLETKTTVEGLAKLKVSGYIQTQWQYADSNGIASRAGGNFPANSRERFQIRRARLKTAYIQPTSKYVLEVDVLPGGFAIKDVNVTLMEPWLKTFSVVAGIMDRPFGFEVPFSSSALESPERSRFAQTFFPGEKDLGVMLAVEPGADMGMLQVLNLKVGAYTGNGGVTLLGSNPPAGFDENDNNKDWIGRLGFKAPFNDLNLDIDGGFSMYMGKVTNTGDTAIAMNDTGFANTTGKKMKDFDRTVYGVDAQVYYDLPVIGGLSLRGEYSWGEMPSWRGSSAPYTPTNNANSPAAVIPLIERNVMGWYVMAVQNLGTKVQAVVKYDVYDPNTDVEGSDVGKAGRSLAKEDLMYTTLGFGANYYWDGNLRLSAYYDRVTNEEAAGTATGGLVPFKSDLNDNVVTVRAQMKF